MRVESPNQKLDETEEFVYRYILFKQPGLTNVSPHMKHNNCSHGQPTHGACGLHRVLSFRVRQAFPFGYLGSVIKRSNR